MKKYRLGIDLGATSLGWSILGLNEKKEPINLLNMGVRIFPDGREAKSSEPLNVKRREHRGTRRNRDRYLQRRTNLMNYLIENDLMPKNERERKEFEKLNPYFLRVKGLDEKLSLYEFGRAIFHLNQRRGFKSNRKLDASDKDTTNMKKAIEELKQEMKKTKSRTIGEYLFNLNKDLPKDKQHHRIPLRVKTTIEKSKNVYNYYPERQMYDEEFEMLWEKQRNYHQVLVDR